MRPAEDMIRYRKNVSGKQNFRSSVEVWITNPFVMWMQQGRNWHFGEIEFFCAYENIDPRLHFDICFMCK